MHPIGRTGTRVVASIAVALIATAAMWSPAARPSVARAAGPSPVAEWTFDEGTASTAHDSVGALDGTLTGGATWDTTSPGQGSGSIVFDGVDGMVTIPDAPALEPAGGFSVVFWVRGAAAVDQNFPIVEKGFYGCDTGGSWEIARVGDRLADSTDLVNYGFPIPVWSSEIPAWDGGWHLTAFVVDPVAGTASTWIDGHKNITTWPGADVIQYGPAGRTDTALHIGGPGADCPQRLPFKGAVDDLRLFGSALTDDQVLALTPSWSTTTTILLSKASGSNGTSISTAYNDEGLLYGAAVHPGPGVASDITWWRSRDGGPEEAFATTPVVIQNGDTFSFFSQPAGTLAPGSYLIHATWPGTPNWGPSTSPTVPLEITRRPVIMTLDAAPTSDVPGGSSTLTARVRVEDPPTSYAVPGSVEFHETTGGEDVLLGSSPLSFVGGPLEWTQATFGLSDLTDGSHTYEARFAGATLLAPGSASTSVVIGPQWSTVVTEVAPDPVLTTAQATATVRIFTGRDSPAATGTLVLKQSPSGTVIGTTTVNGPGPYAFVLPVFPAGVQHLVAEYSGDVDFVPSSSPIVDLTIVPDLVDASGVGVAYTSFYPVKDGYRDTLLIIGRRNEPASVVIRVYNAGNKLMKSFSVPSAAGAYSVTWTGRSSAGAMLPTGTYKVTQTLTDTAGMHLVVTSKVALSGKKIVYYTRTITKLASSVSSVGHAGTGRGIAYADHSIKVDARSGWAAAGWQFALPSATVYSKISFGLYGFTGVPPGSIGVEDFRACGYSSSWDISCFARWKSVGFTKAWSTISMSPTYNRHGRAVRAVLSQYIGSSKVYKVRLVVRYGILK